jgi:DNA repair protein RecN (Recombination protein N)
VVLSELRVRELGVIEDVTLVLVAGMTVLTGETGAGKTLLVEAISLLTGGSPPPGIVRPGAAQAVVEARFELRRPAGAPVPHGDGLEAPSPDAVLRRVIASSGRGRAYLDGAMVTAAQLADTGRGLVDLHGQNTHQSLLSPSAQRRALDAAAGIDTSPLAKARARLRDAQGQLEGLGGDATARARETDLTRYQLAELDGAGLTSADEEAALREEEEALSDVAGLREAALSAWSVIQADGGAGDILSSATAGMASRPRLSALRERLLAAREEILDVATEARVLAEQVEDDPERLAAVRDRLHMLRDLRRRYGETLEQVIEFRERLRLRLDELEGHDRRAIEVEALVSRGEQEVAAAEAELFEARRSAAVGMSFAVTSRLHQLALPRARFDIDVSAGPDGGKVTWMLGANPGEPLLPLGRVASGGELSRAMLAARLASMASPPARPLGEDTGDLGPTTLVFDEVDAGVGGEAAVEVGRALHDLSRRYQVLVVTHLPQVAAFAEHHLVVSKEVIEDRTVASVTEVCGAERVVELARMISGRPDSETARRHAEELLGSAGAAPEVG